MTAAATLELGSPLNNTLVNRTIHLGSMLTISQDGSHAHWRPHKRSFTWHHTGPDVLLLYT